MNRPLSHALLCAGLVLGLTACESAKEDLGLARRTPDAFAVVTRAPLDVPPDYYLRPPTPGAPRPQEQTPTAQAANAVFGSKTSVAKGTSKAEQELLQQTNAHAADPTIRATIDAETKEIIQADRPAVKKLLGLEGTLQTAPAKVINPKEETERLSKEKADKANKPAK